MDIKMNMSARLNQEDLKNLIREAMEAHTGRQVANIEFSLGENVCGYMDRGGSYQVTGCTVNFVEEPLAMKPRVSRAPSNADHNTRQWGDH